MHTIKPMGEVSGCRVAAYGNAMITVFSSSGRMEQLELIERVHRQMADEHGKFINVLVVAAAKIEPMSAEMREASARLEQRFEEQTLCSAIVITATGLAAVVTRTFLVGYNLIFKRKAPMQVFRDFEAGVAWIENTAQGAAPAGLLAAAKAFAAGSTDRPSSLASNG